MDLPKYKGGNAGTYLFGLVCFICGIVFLTALSIGRIRYDAPTVFFSKLQSGKIGIGEAPVTVFGAFLLLVVWWVMWHYGHYGALN
jgi:hypothetical protein